MKKITAILLVLAIIFGFASCGEKTKPKKKIKKVVIIEEDDNTSKNSDDFETDEEEDEEIIEYIEYEEEDEDSSDNNVPALDTKVLGVKKLLGSNIGDSYYVVSLLDNHPGVAGMDAYYYLTIRDKMGTNFVSSDFDIICDNKDITLSGAQLKIPYKVRSSDTPVNVKVINKKYPNRTGYYTFKFQKYSSTPTLLDNFDTLNTDLWKEGAWYASCPGGYIENGELVLRVENEADAKTKIVTTTGTFNQAYGCFSARIKMPEKGLVNGAFWLCTEDGVRYIKNKQRPTQSGGELDIVEYFPNWGNGYAATIHWNGWSDYHMSSGQENLGIGEPLNGTYHIYSSVWTPEAIYWYLDGQLLRTYKGDGVGKDSGPMQILLQISPKTKNDSWGGAYDPTQYPYEMRTDWVSVYALED